MGVKLISKIQTKVKSAEHDPTGQKYNTAMYPKFAKLFIQIAEPENIQHNSRPA